MLKSLHTLKNGYIFVPTNKLKHKTMIVVDTFDKGVTKETLKDFVMTNGNFSITTEEDIVDIHLLDNRFFVILNGNPVLSRKTFTAIWNWIDRTDIQWQLQDDLS